MPSSQSLSWRLLYAGLAATLLLSLLTMGAVKAPAASADTGCPVAAGSYAGGDGAASPWQIATSAQLQRLRDDSATGWDDSFILTADINMSGCTWTSTIGNASLGFTGRLDGGGFDVSGLTVSVTTSGANAYAGLVGRLLSPGVVTRIGFSGNVSASATNASFPYSYAGGLVGYADSGTTISYSTASGSVSASSNNNASFPESSAGGLVGTVTSAAIYDSFATGASTSSVTGSMPIAYAGGLVGNINSGVASRSYASGTASASGLSTRRGGFAGRSYGMLSNNFNDTTSGMATGVGFGTNAGVTGETTTRLQQFATYDDSGWDIVNGWQPFDPGSGKVWGICQGSTRAFLLWQYTVSPCASAPGAPTIAGVTPAMTTAGVAFTADDSGGSTITRLEFALDDTATVDDSTTNLASPFALTGLTGGTSHRVFMRAVNTIGTGQWSAGTLFRTLNVPGVPTIAGVTPAMTTANVAYTADDSGGSPITRLEFALDDTAAVDDSTTSLVSPFTLNGLSAGASYRVFMRAVNVWGTGAWSAGTLFTTPAPPVPVPASAPTRVVAVGSDGRVEVHWQEPSSPGTFPVMQYLATATPGGRTCLTAETSCTIGGLANGTSYTVTVQALTGVGWSTASAPSNTVTPRGPDAKTLHIVGSRGEGSAAGTIFVEGTSTRLVGAAVTLKITFPGQAPTTSTTPITIASDGTFAWSRKTNKQVRIVALADGVRSAPVVIPAR